ncbi:sigma-70 region 2 family protein [Mycobacterium kansasii 662]|uniref:RNA polymerase sigma factor n=1 Tax=Mycobacterium kansasii 662 TaxID=1299326 RepID=X7XNW6_MYCKA|nr:sigma-70 region 2 family protein [Mycobacterium kansasii 662]
MLETIRPIVVRYCRARVGTIERSGLTADDVAQEVCLATITALPRYRDRGRPFLAFLYGIAAHKVADAHRAAGRDLAYPAESVPDRRSATPAPNSLSSRPIR